jgi:hypothetical protein
MGIFSNILQKITNWVRRTEREIEEEIPEEPEMYRHILNVDYVEHGRFKKFKAYVYSAISDIEHWKDTLESEAAANFKVYTGYSWDTWKEEVILSTAWGTERVSYDEEREGTIIVTDPEDFGETP